MTSKTALLLVMIQPDLSEIVIRERDVENLDEVKSQLTFVDHMKAAVGGHGLAVRVIPPVDEAYYLPVSPNAQVGELFGFFDEVKPANLPAPNDVVVTVSATRSASVSLTFYVDADKWAGLIAEYGSEHHAAHALMESDAAVIDGEVVHDYDFDDISCTEEAASYRARYFKFWDTAAKNV